MCIYIRVWICILYLYYIYMLQKNILLVSVSHYCYSKSTICYHNIMHNQKIVPVDSWVHIYFSTSNCTRNMHVIMSIYDEMSPMSVQFTNTNSLRCLHSILSLFKRTWRFSMFCCGEPWRFSEWTTHLGRCQDDFFANQPKVIMQKTIV